jgi:cyclopropane fatty-acyl-phospholipid synthase-like methyltransferase
VIKQADYMTVHPDDYKQIFEQRAWSYHKAMVEFPHARDNEFLEMARLADVGPGDTVVDIPSGGGYLHRFLDSSARIIAQESCPDFVRHIHGYSNAEIMSCDMEALPLEDATVDRVISLAAVHHVLDKRSFFSEMHRVLKPGGKFCLGDVWVDTPVATFLNGFLDKHNSMGHKGMFLGPETAADLEAVGFTVEVAESRPYGWQFRSREDIGYFCKLLFGIDLADEQIVTDAIEDILGIEKRGEWWEMNWELYFIRAGRPGG